MARGLFITGFNVSEVLAIQRRAKELLLEGKTVMNWNDADTSVSKQFAMSVAEVLEKCAHALRVLDPATYGKPRIAVTSFIFKMPQALTGMANGKWVSKPCQTIILGSQLVQAVGQACQILDGGRTGFF
jgi:hypothetical protein